MRNKVRVMFKNGHEVLIDQEIAKQLITILASGNTKEVIRFQFFSKPTGELIFGVNVAEIEYLIDMNYR
jgi:hypothetical protein